MPYNTGHHLLCTSTWSWSSFDSFFCCFFSSFDQFPMVAPETRSRLSLPFVSWCEYQLCRPSWHSSFLCITAHLSLYTWCARKQRAHFVLRHRPSSCSWFVVFWSTVEISRFRSCFTFDFVLKCLSISSSSSSRCCCCTVHQGPFALSLHWQEFTFRHSPRLRLWPSTIDEYTHSNHHNRVIQESHTRTVSASFSVFTRLINSISFSLSKSHSNVYFIVQSRAIDRSCSPVDFTLNVPKTSSIASSISIGYLKLDQKYFIKIPKDNLVWSFHRNHNNT